jgi:hypothetical protein
LAVIVKPHRKIEILGTILQLVEKVNRTITLAYDGGPVVPPSAMTPATTVYGYGQVEEALARVHRIATPVRGAFKARIKHFQRLGMVPQSPGKGKKIAYGVADVYRWELGLQFVEFGIDPTAIKSFLETTWDKLRPHLDVVPDRKLVFHPRFLSRVTPEEGAWYRPVPPGVLAMQAIVVNNISELDPTELTYGFEDRFGLINLGRLRREVDAALAAVSA